MNPERWQQIEKLFHAALEYDASERAAFLARECAGDISLRREIESLLASHDRNGRSLDAADIAADLFEESHVDQIVGRTLGPYKIVKPLGRGGMGAVFLAEDAKLARRIALKVLPAEFTQDRDRLRRFEQEARAASALNHPNIITIYDSGDSGDLHFIAMEFVDGVTLRERLTRGRLKLGEALDIASQVASALAAAHAAGIVHRDIKPENILLRRDGYIKVLDFGLAKLTVLPAATDAADTKSQFQTEAGIVVGTPNYMSPEQVRGSAADSRSDIFSFGGVFYELLSGRRAFEAATPVESMNAILNEDPPELSPEIPPALQRIVRRCLDKQPEKRFQSAEDLAFTLRALATDSEPGLKLALPAVAYPKSRQRLAWAGAVLLLVFLVAAIALGTGAYFRRAPLDAPVYRVSVLPPGGARIGGGPPPAYLALSPDGHRLAFVATSDRVRLLYVRSLDSLAPQVLDGSEGALAPFWSSDGRFIAFFAQGKLKKVALSGGPPVTLADVSGTPGGTWNRDDVILFAGNRSALRRVSASGGAPAPVTTLDAAGGETGHWWPSFLPDGRHFLYHATGSKTGGPFDARALYIGALGSDERKVLLEGGSNAQYSQGHLLFIRQGTLMAQPFDTERLELTGDAVAVAERVETDVTARQFGAFSASPAGVLAYQVMASRARSQLVWFDRAGRQLSVLGDQAYYVHPELSPDRKHGAVAIFDAATETRDIWLFDLARGGRTRFTSATTDERFPNWSPDGNRIVFTSGREGTFDLYQKASNGIGDEKLLLHDSLNKYPTSWSADGRFILYYTGGSTPQTGNDLWALPLFGDQKPFPFLQTKFAELEGHFSPDGHWVVYQSNESGQLEVYVAPFPTPDGKWRISTSGGRSPGWRGNEIFYLTPDNKLFAASVNARGSAFEVGAVRALFQTQPHEGTRSWVASADGQRFLVNTTVEGPTTASITVVINWMADLKR